MKTMKIMKTLQKYATFEMAIGINGIIWVKCESIANTILILNILKNS